MNTNIRLNTIFFSKIELVLELKKISSYEIKSFHSFSEIKNI